VAAGSPLKKNPSREVTVVSIFTEAENMPLKKDSHGNPYTRKAHGLVKIMPIEFLHLPVDENNNTTFALTYFGCRAKVPIGGQSASDGNAATLAAASAASRSAASGSSVRTRECGVKTAPLEAPIQSTSTDAVPFQAIVPAASSSAAAASATQEEPEQLYICGTMNTPAWKRHTMDGYTPRMHFTLRAFDRVEPYSEQTPDNNRAYEFTVFDGAAKALIGLDGYEYATLWDSGEDGPAKAMAKAESILKQVFTMKCEVALVPKKTGEGFYTNFTLYGVDEKTWGV
jgi:hypothetical protein